METFQTVFMAGLTHQPETLSSVGHSTITEDWTDWLIDKYKLAVCVAVCLCKEHTSVSLLQIDVKK